MSFVTGIMRVPRPFDPDRAGEVARQFSDVPDAARDLLSGTAGCSPYLKGLMEREAAWLREALSASPDATLRAELDRIPAIAAPSAAAGLREAKRRLALMVALADLGGLWTLPQVTGALTELADLAVHRALSASLAPLVARGRFPSQGADDLADLCGMVVLAMGKMGARELNYSSDIDLICLFDQARFDPSDFAEVRAAFIRATRSAMGLLSEVTRDGYVFRTDLRLRPDPSVTPVCLSLHSAERYYESRGRTWERVAHIKARVCAGDRRAGDAYLEDLRPFVWRRHLDYAVIRETQEMRAAMRRAQAGQGEGIAGLDLKRGPGGIREIEFFTQAQQIVSGGRQPELRVRGTAEGLQRLAAGGWIASDTARTLAADYTALRELEHRLQMVGDTQTHALPQDDEGFERLACFLDRDTDGLRAEIAERSRRVAALTAELFEPAAPRPRADAPALTPEQGAIVARWANYPALRSTRAVAIFERLRPGLLSAILSAPRPTQALAHFDGFLAGLPAGVQIFSLFEANPQLTDLIVDIAGSSAELSEYLSRNSAVLDAVIAGRFFEPWPGADALGQDLNRLIASAADYEAKLDAARAWMRDWHFRIGVHHLRGLIGSAEAAGQYTDLARATIAALWPAVTADFAERHGASPGRGAMILGLGSLGAGQMTARSDLDLIFIYDAPPEARSEGPRPLSVPSYYARLTQATLTALSAPMASGRLYEVDMRLRPSGRQGPLATSLTAFTRYQSEAAWTWEHMALTRAACVAGPPELFAGVGAVLTEVRRRPRDRDATLRAADEMRARLATRRARGAWDPSSGPGRLHEIGLVATACGLLARSDARDTIRQIGDGHAAGLLDAASAGALSAATRTLGALRMAAQLLGSGSLDPAGIGAGGEAMLLRETGEGDLAALETRIARESAAAAAAVDEFLGPAERSD